MTWVRQLLDWQSDVEDPGEFLESLRFEINRAEVYVFTPRGDVIALPAGATPVDFAYAVHTEVGHHTIGARVNGRLVPLESTLENSDVVEVFTSKSPTAGPSRDWLTFVKSPRARSKIRQWFTKERREEAIERGKEQIAKLMRKEGLPLKRLMSHESLMLVAAHFNIADVSALYAAVGEGNLSAQAVVRRVIDLHGGDEGAAEDLSEAVTITGRRSRGKASAGGDAGVIVKGAPDVWVKLAKCCTPVPPDDILGFVTKGGGVSVHRTDCTNAASLRSQPEKLLEVEWAPTGQSTFLVNIQVEALDRARLLSDITMVLSDAHVNIRQRQPLDLARPRGQEPLHLRDGGVQAPRHRAARGALGARRLRRLPRHPVGAASISCTSGRGVQEGKSGLDRSPRVGPEPAAAASGHGGTGRGRGGLTRVPEGSAGSAGEVGRGPPGHVEEGLARGEVLLEVGDLLLVTRRRGPPRGRARSCRARPRAWRPCRRRARTSPGRCGATARPPATGSPARRGGSAPRAP